MTNRVKGPPVDERGKIDHWLQHLTGRKDATLRVDGTFQLVLDKKLTVTLFVPEDGSRLMLMADVLRLDALTSDVLQEVAAVNLRFDLTGGLTVALEKNASTVVAFTQYALDSLDPDAFRSVLETMERKLRNLREHLEVIVQRSREQIPSELTSSILREIA
jgi:hypothetical protein